MRTNASTVNAERESDVETNVGSSAYHKSYLPLKQVRLERRLRYNASPTSRHVCGMRVPSQLTVLLKLSEQPLQATE